MARAAFVIIFLAAAANAADTFPLTGTVVDAVTGVPVRLASVGIQFLSPAQPGALNQTVIADAAGHFEFPNLGAGTVLLWAERRGYSRQNSTHQVGPGAAELTLRLTPYSVVIGKVVDENGDPVIGAHIQVLRSVLLSGLRSLQPANSASTNDLGEYRVAQLQPGRYYLSASARSGAPPGMIYGAVYYAGASDFSGATPVDLTGGSETRADFHMEPAPAFSIRGRIVDAMPEANIVATLSPKGTADAFNASSHPVRVTPGTGEFEISGVPSGSYILTASAFRGGDRSSGTQEVTVGKADLEDVSLTFRKPAQITGTVRVEESERVSPLDPNRIGFILRPREAGLRMQPSARLLPDKSFIIPDVAPGDYLLQVSLPDPYYLKSALLGGVDANISGISVAPGSIPAPLDIVIGSKGGEVNGTVMKDDKPVPNCGVLLMRSRGSAAAEKIARTDPAGHFVFSAVAPGDYTAYAFDDVNEIEYRNPDVLQRYWGENVTVFEGEKASVKLKWNQQP